MLTVEQVKKYSDLFLWRDSPLDLEYQDYRYCGARLCYLHNNRLSRLRVRCTWPTGQGDAENLTEDDISLAIEWQKFIDWINKHDDLSEGNLLTSEQFSKHLTLHRYNPPGRNGTLDLVNSKVIDHSKEVLV